MRPITPCEQVSTLRLSSVSRHTGGRYTCQADNGGRVVSTGLRLHVQYAPEIHVDRWGHT